MDSKKRYGYIKTLKTLIVLAVPTMVEEVLATLLQYVDTAMVGHLGEQAGIAAGGYIWHYDRRHIHAVSALYPRMDGCRGSNMEGCIGVFFHH